MFFKVEDAERALGKNYCTAPHASCQTPRAAAHPLSLCVLAPPCRRHLRHDPTLSSFALSSPPSAVLRILSPRSLPSRWKSIRGGDRSSSYFIVLLVGCPHLVASRHTASPESGRLLSMPPAPSLACHCRYYYYNHCYYHCSSSWRPTS